MIDLPPIVVYVTVAVGVALLFLAAFGLTWLVADWRRAPRGRDALDRWNGGGR